MDSLPTACSCGGMYLVFYRMDLVERLDLSVTGKPLCSAIYRVSLSVYSTSTSYVKYIDRGGGAVVLMCVMWEIVIL